jgi:DNA adenine methylase
MAVRPFIKWLGGKTQMIKQLESYFPAELKSGGIDTYVEPFLGGGAVFFYLIRSYPHIKHYYVSDSNIDLMDCYLAIKDHSTELLAELNKLEGRYKYLPIGDTWHYDCYHQVRWDFNSPSTGLVKRAAQFIFLNKTGFNGLYRVNNSGSFNVPWGKETNPTIFNPRDLKDLSEALSTVEVSSGDYKDCAQYVTTRSLVYFDPPYRPISKTSNFTAYSPGRFTDADQLGLSLFYKDLSSLGTKLMLSNSSTGDGYFESLYEGFRIETLKSKRAINSDGTKRGPIDEILVLNYSD